MNILIRCDSSNIIGTGHVMRCLNYCEYYPENKFTFVCRNFKNNITAKILEKGHNLILLEYEIEPELNKYESWIGCDYKKEIEELIQICSKNYYDEIIIDHYGIEYKLEIEIKKLCKKLIIINELYEYKHFCDIYINFICDDIKKAKEINLFENTEYKIGIENLIINKKFLKIKKEKPSEIKNLCIMLGGADPENFICKIIEEIKELIKNKNIFVYIIIGKSNIYKDKIEKLIDNNYKILVDLNYDELINIYLKVDLCIGSLSVSAYERLFIGLPQICLHIADNQKIVNKKEFNICSINYLKDKLLYFISNE